MFIINNTNPELKDNVDSSALNSSSSSGSSSGSNINLQYGLELLNKLGLSIDSGHINAGKIFRAKFNDEISDKELIEKDFTVKVLIKEERKALGRNPGDFLMKFERQKMFIKTLIHRILSNTMT